MENKHKKENLNIQKSKQIDQRDVQHGSMEDSSVDLNSRRGQSIVPLSHKSH